MARVTADTTSVEIHDVPLTDVSFSVAATNEFGEGPASSVTVPPALQPARFEIAAWAGASALRATGAPSGPVTQGTVTGLVGGQPLLSAPITQAGVTTVDGQEVIVVRSR